MPREGRVPVRVSSPQDGESGRGGLESAARPAARAARLSPPALRASTPGSLPPHGRLPAALLTSDSWGRREPGGRQTWRLVKPPRKEGHGWASGRAGRDRGVPRPSPLRPGGSGAYDSSQSSGSGRREAAGGRRGGEGRDKPARGEGGGGGRERGKGGAGGPGAASSPHLPHRQRAWRARSGWERLRGWGGQARGPGPREEGNPRSPFLPERGLPSGAGGNPRWAAGRAMPPAPHPLTAPGPAGSSRAARRSSYDRHSHSPSHWPPPAPAPRALPPPPPLPRPPRARLLRLCPGPAPRVRCPHPAHCRRASARDPSRARGTWEDPAL